MSSDPQTQINKTLQSTTVNKASAGDESQIRPVQVIWQIIQMLQKKGVDEKSDQFLQHQEKLLYFAMQAHYSQQVSGQVSSNLPADLDFTEQLLKFVQNSNQVAMASISQASQQENAVNLMIKAIDILMYKHISKLVRPIQKLGELKVITFNNLAIIYQERKQFQFALKAIHYASVIEQKLVQDNYKDCKFSILSTLMNKAAIQSSLQRHDKALQTLQSAMRQIDILERLINDQQQQQNQGDNQDNNTTNNNNENLEEQGNKVQEEQVSQSQIDQTKYLKLVCLYNAGAENEHLFHKDKATQYYKKALNLAQQLDQQDMIQRLNQALNI